MFENRIRKMNTEVLVDLLEQYIFEHDCQLDNHLEKISIIEAELKSRATEN